MKFQNFELHNVLRVLNGNSRQIESRMLQAEAHVKSVIEMINEELHSLN